MAELPGAVELVAQPPIGHLVRGFTTVLAALVGPVGVARFVGVLHPIAGVVHRAEAAVDADVGLGADALAVAQKLVGAEAIGLEVVPGQLGPHRALVLGADAVLPVVARGEVAAGITQDRDAELLHRLHDVGAIAVFIGEGAAFLVDAAVDHAAEMFGEVAEEVRVHLTDSAIDIDLDARSGRLRE